MCVYHKSNGNDWQCPVCALARCYLYLHGMGADPKIFLLAHYNGDKGQHSNITNKDVIKALKAAATVLDYSMAKGVPVHCINTHSLWSGGDNALSLAGYLDTQIQKMGWWQGATFKEYTRRSWRASQKECQRA